MRQILHVLVAVAFWLVLAGLWVQLVREHEATASTLRDTALELAALAGVVLAITTWWIRHNVGIYRRKGPRTGRPEVPPETAEDRLGRPVRWSLSGGSHSARSARHLVVEVADGVKVYRRPR